MKNNFSGSLVVDAKELIAATKLSKFSLNSGLSNKTGRTYFIKKFKIRHAAAFHKIASVFELPNLLGATRSYIERCFTVIAESLLELEFVLFSRILASSELFVTSELEVLDASIKWLSHNFEERKQFGARLLRKVRLHTLPSLQRSLPLKNNKCREMVEEAHKRSREKPDDRKSRYCSQKNFEALVCGGFVDDDARKVKLFSLPEFKARKTLPNMKQGRLNFEAVYLKGSVYAFSGRHLSGNDRRVTTVEKYSLLDNCWTDVIVMPDRRIHYCACAFTDKIFIFGGMIRDSYVSEDTCFEFDTSNRWFNMLAPMGVERQQAACALFQETVVVSGGGAYEGLRHAERYQPWSNRWARMPDMNFPRKGHKLVAVGSKLYAVGGQQLVGPNFRTCEVYDGQEFTRIIFPFKMWQCQALSVGRKILVFGRNVTASYDVSDGKWSEESSKEIFVRGYSCVKLPYF